MATVEELYADVFKAAGPLDAVAACEPPGARGGSGLPWYHSLLNLLGIVKVKRSEAAVYLGLRGGELVYVAFNDDDEVVSQGVLPLAAITGAQVKPKNEWTHDVSFQLEGKPHHYAVCGYAFGRETPDELKTPLKQMAERIVAAIAARA